MENINGEKLDARNKTHIEITAEPHYTIPPCSTGMIYIMFPTWLCFISKKVI
jgi:hypothetical protein